MLTKIWQKHHQFFKYCLIGFISIMPDFALFYFFIKTTSTNYLWLNVFTISIGITISFLLNAKFNFKISNNYLRSFAKFYMVGTLGIAISNLILFLLHGQLQISSITSKAVAILIVTLIQYYLNKNYSLKNRHA